jgi:exopolysaccharide biosynthesis polyprenyl glycosylphosphotransferase
VSNSVLQTTSEVPGDGVAAAPAYADTGARERPVRPFRRRGWLVRRALVVADLAGLTLAFVIAEEIAGQRGLPVRMSFESLLFVITIPVWVLMAKIYGLYERDEERTEHTTVDDFVGVFHLVTVGVWVLFAGAWLFKVAYEYPPLDKLTTFWILAIVLIPVARSAARAFCHRREAYLQNTVIVGAGDVGQLVARKLLQHPEYGIRLLGFVDSNPKSRREEVEHLPMLGSLDGLPEIIERNRVERVVVSFSNDSNTETLEAVRGLRDFDVQVDIVPRLYELIAPSVGIHTVEGLPLVGLPPVKLSRSSRLLKRGIDVIGAIAGLVVTAPLFAFVAYRIKRDSPGPVFFRQERIGLNREPFTVLKFRTMRSDIDDQEHRDYIRATMTAAAVPQANGMYKLNRDDAVTPFGRWLRKTSLDELPQLINVLRGEMSLVGPRPCIAYETELFAPHHFERFLVRPGLTGLWQVVARAHSTFGEALDMDVAYVRGWSLWLDVTLIFRTPLQLLRGGSTA